MALGTFDVYDILADIIPGSIATLFLIVLAVPQDSLSQVLNTFSGPGGAVIFIAIGYVVGRIVRNVSIYGFLKG